MDLQFLKSILNVIQDFFRRWRFRYYLTLAYFSYWRSLLRRPNQVIASWTNGAPLGPRVVVFVHYDAEGTVQPFVMPYLQALHDLGL